MLPQFGFALTCEETLADNDKKPFIGLADLLRRANPLANISLLFRSVSATISSYLAFAA